MSGVDCILNLNQWLNKTQNETTIEWKFGFEADITEAASNRFVNLTKDLSIASCEYDICTLNDSIKYYIDGKLIGSEDITADSKGKPYSKPLIGGILPTKEGASDMLHFAQATLAGELDAKIDKIEQVGPTFSKDFALIMIVTAVIIGMVGAAVVAAQLKSGFVFLISFFTSTSEFFIVLGVLTGLNFVIKPMTVFALVALPAITAVYQNVIALKIKKESFILKKIAELDGWINKILLVLLVVAAILVFALPEIGSPLLVYLLIVTILSKGIFINSIKEKK
jgi:hypothetical protein